MCPRDDCENEAIVDNYYGILPCRSCQSEDTNLAINLKTPEFYNQTKKDRITSDRDKHGKDIIQPWVGKEPNPEFVKAYPHMAKDYFSDEELRKI